ncbi:hypothetical protein [Nonomuraea sp. NPDC023979]|uniref:hypothetical protein n=1 Tax=Nonomuraea sp. NPDC023979 TaxID=3154796 RepID=UPI0033FB5392
MTTHNSQTDKKAEWNEGIAEFAANLKDLYAKWPPDHRFHELIPGVIIPVILLEAAKPPTDDEIRQVIIAAYAKADMPDHRHVATVCEATIDFKDLVEY